MMPNLIICPVGMEMPHDPRWKKEDHWRWTHNKRNYETLLVVYNDFEPEPGSYDHLIRMKGNKFQIVRNVAHDIPLGKYNYIACVDDDLITGYQDFNIGLEYAEKFNFQCWQLSMPHDSSLIFQPLFNDPTCDFSETNFIEMGSPFFKEDKFRFLMEFLDHWDNIESHFKLEIGWGIDKTFYDMFQCPCNVVHSGMIHQPFRDSYYDKSRAMAEMNEYLYSIYPRILKQHYGRESRFIDRQETFRKFKIMPGENNE
jgi:hypothetical protein